jgi:hypothetical protein
MNRYLDLGMMTTTGFWSTLNKAPNCRNPLNTVSIHHPKSLFSILTGKQGTSIPSDNVDENKVLVCYTNPDKILARLSSSTKKNLTILLLRFPRNNQSRSSSF